MVVGWCKHVHECVGACMRACVRDVFAIYDNNILPRLIMIIIKIIFLYFIEIAHTDDFPSTGTLLVWCKNLTLNIRVCFSLMGRGSSMVGAPLQNLGKFVYPSLPVSFGCETKPSVPTIWCLCQGK